MPVPEHIRVTTPGRMCLFGEHQDFLGLPVIACVIDLAMEIVVNTIRLTIVCSSSVKLDNVPPLCSRFGVFWLGGRLGIGHLDGLGQIHPRQTIQPRHL